MALILLTWSMAAGYYPQFYPGWKPAAYWMLSLVTTLMFYGSVLLHELGHAFAAQRMGVPVHSITLFLLGGVAQIAHEPEEARSELWIVSAGPLASLALAAFFLFLSHFARSGNLYWFAAGEYLGRVNLILCLFNLLPGYPLDGGRLLRGLLWHWRRDYERATFWARATGYSLALLFVLGAAALFWQGNLLSSFWIGLIGGYLGVIGYQEHRQSMTAAAEELDGATDALQQTRALGDE